MKVWDKWSSELVGRECWVEFIGNDGHGKNVHYLFRAEVGFLPLEKAGPTIETKRNGRTVSLTPIDALGDCIVFWDEKPTEPYFKDGWPEWEVLGEG